MDERNSASPLPRAALAELRRIDERNSAMGGLTPLARKLIWGQAGRFLT
jgi:hypothetical protein